MRSSALLRNERERPAALIPMGFPVGAARITLRRTLEEVVSLME